MTTMTTTTKTAPTSATTMTTRRWKWSGETDEPDYDRWNHDEEQTTYKEREQMLKDAAWRDYAHSHEDDDDNNDDHECCFDDDECPSLLPAAQQQRVQPHVPFMNLTKEERDKKSDRFKFGLCAHCDAGLDDESDFVCEARNLQCSWVMACNACHDYYQQLAYLRVVDDNGGCN